MALFDENLVNSPLVSMLGQMRAQPFYQFNPGYQQPRSTWADQYYHPMGIGEGIATGLLGALGNKVAKDNRNQQLEKMAPDLQKYGISMNDIPENVDLSSISDILLNAKIKAAETAAKEGYMDKPLSGDYRKFISATIGIPEDQIPKDITIKTLKELTPYGTGYLRSQTSKFHDELMVNSKMAITKVIGQQKMNELDKKLASAKTLQDARQAFQASVDQVKFGLMAQGLGEREAHDQAIEAIMQRGQDMRAEYGSNPLDLLFGGGSPGATSQPGSHAAPAKPAFTPPAKVQRQGSGSAKKPTQQELNYFKNLPSARRPAFLQKAKSMGYDQNDFK